MLYINPALDPGAQTIDSPERRKMALREFEQMYLREMLKSMRQTVPDGGLFEKDQQQQFFQEMLDDALAGKMAESGQFGLASQIQRQLDQQEAALKHQPFKESGPGIVMNLQDKGLPIQPAGDAGRGMPIKFPPSAFALSDDAAPLNVQRMLQRADN